MDGNDLQKLEIRVRNLENKYDTREAVNAERRAQTEAEFKRVHDRLDKIDGNISKVVWLVLAAVIGGFLSFMMQGGFGSAI